MGTGRERWLWKSSRRGKRYIKMKIILEKRRLRYTSRRCRTTLSVSGSCRLSTLSADMATHHMHVCSQFRHPWQTGQYWRPTFSGGVGSCRPALWPDSRQTSRTKKLFIQCCYYLCLLYYILFPRSVAGLLRQPSAAGCRLSKTAAVTDGRFTVGSYVPAGP